MDTRKVATTLATQATIAVLCNMYGSWLSRWVTWNPQATLRGVISACIYTPTYFAAFKAQDELSNKNPKYHLLPPGYQTNKINRIRWVSFITGIIATTILTPRISKYFESPISTRASFAFSFFPFVVSYAAPYSKERGI